MVRERVCSHCAARAFLSSTFAFCAIQRFFSSAASSSSSRAEQPATPLRGAERPAISSIQDVQRWLARLPAASHADIERIREAVPVLSRPKRRKEDVQPLQTKWQIAQQKHRKPRPLEDVLQEFQTKVIKAAKKLQLELGLRRQALPTRMLLALRAPRLQAPDCKYESKIQPIHATQSNACNPIPQASQARQASQGSQANQAS